MNRHLPYRQILFLTLIVFVGIFFRFYQIGKSPAGVYVDEASIGYNAYSLLKTDKDEFGKFMPFMFRSFATFQSPVYTYLTVPFIYLFGLSSFSTRFPSAFFGVLTIPVLYFLAKKLFSSENRDLKSEIFPLLSALLLAISPWHIQYSRTAYEANIALFFLLLGSLLYLYAIKKPWLFVLSALSLAVSMNAYRAEILIIPILLFTFILGTRKTIKTQLRSYLPPAILGFFLGLSILIPLMSILWTPGFQARTSSMNIFSVSLQTPWGFKDSSNNLDRIINNPQLLSVKEFLSLYASYFSPRYVFSLGDAGPRKPYTDVGTLFVWQFPFYLIGLYLLLKRKDLKNLRLFVFTLLLVSPVPAALTRDPYSTIRSLPMVIPLLLIVSFGLVAVLESAWWLVLKRYKYFIFAFVLISSSTQLFISIFCHHDYFRSVYWNYGWQQAINSISTLDPKLPIVVDNSHGDSYIELLFFLSYDPATYQRDNFEVSSSEYYTNMTRNGVKNIGQFKVKSFQWGIDTDHVDQYILADNIAIGAVQIKEHNLSIIDEIHLPDGTVALRILKTNPKK